MTVEAHRLGNFLAVLNQITTERELFTELASSLGDFVPAARISVALRLPDRDMVEVIALCGSGQHMPLGHRVPLVDSAVGAAVLGKRVVPWEVESRKYSEASSLLGVGVKYSVVVPLLIDDTVLGTLNLARAESAFADREISWLEKVATVVAATVSRMRLLSQAQDDLERQRSYSEKLEATSQVAARLSGATDQGEAFTLMAEAMAEMFGAERVSFVSRVGEEQFLVRWVSGNQSIAQGSLHQIVGGSQEEALLHGKVAHFVDFEGASFPELTKLAQSGIKAGSSYPVQAGNGALNIAGKSREICSPQNESLILALVAILNAVLERIQAQDRSARFLREQQARFKAISQAVSLGLFLTDAQGVRTYANPAMEALTSEDGWLSHICDEDRADIAAAWTAFVEKPTPRMEVEYTTVGGNCQRMVASPIADGAEVLGFVGTLTDVTETKRRDTALWHAQKMESLGVLAGGLAHDFNNILAAALGNLNLIEDSVGEASGLAPELEQLGTALRRGAQLTRQMLAYAGKARRQLRSLELNELIAEMGALLSASLPKSVHLRLDLPHPPVRIPADPTQLQQVLMNLLTNAADAMPVEGGTITVQVRSTVVGEESPWNVGPGRYAEILCIDDGVGMSQEVADRIFDPFYTTKEGGTGLGLSASMGIVRSHQGDLRVESTPGSGTTFRLLFPETAGAPVTERSGGPLVYLADDEPQVRLVVGKMLRRLGFEVVEAADGAELLEGIERETGTITLVCTDISMPRLDGLQVARTLARDRPEVPCILMSGYVEKRGEAELESLGFFLEKPFSMKTLREVVGQATS